MTDKEFVRYLSNFEKVDKIVESLEDVDLAIFMTIISTSIDVWCIKHHVDAETVAEGIYEAISHVSKKFK